jgi:hypothetical protein
MKAKTFKSWRTSEIKMLKYFFEKGYSDKEISDFMKTHSPAGITAKRLKIGLNKHELRRKMKSENPLPPKVKKTPKNYKQIGDESIYMGEVWVKTKKGWKSKNRVLYEKFHGKIPKGKIVVFKNKNNRDFSAENLIAVTRSENMKRNHNYEKMKKTIKETWDFVKERREKYGENRGWFKSDKFWENTKNLSKIGKNNLKKYQNERNKD